MPSDNTQKPNICCVLAPEVNDGLDFHRKAGEHGRPYKAPRDYKAIYAERKARGEFDRHKGIPTMVRLPPEVHEKLAVEANGRDRSIAWMVTRLVTEGLERLIPADEWRLTRD